MTRYVALLRAINVGGRNLVAMAALRALLLAEKWAEPQTLLQSGNVIFRGPARAPARIETALEGAIAQQLGVACDVFVRTAAEWAAIVANNPFPDEARRDPGHLVVLLQKAPATAAQLAAVQGAIVGNERVELAGRDAYVVYPDGIGRSKLTTAVLEKHLGTRVTARNWNTVGKIATLLGAEI